MSLMGGSIQREKRYIQKIPAIVWGRESKDAYIYVHGKMSRKEEAEEFAKIAETKGYQTISFDLPEHGEREVGTYCFDIWNGKNDLSQIAEYAFGRWENLSLYACSMGAHFSLHTYSEMNFQSCLFQSPILDMDYLIGRIFEWYHLSEEQLRQQRVIQTPIHKLTWDYYQYVKEHPITKWEIPTSILYAGQDGLQDRRCMERFAEQFHCQLTIEENANHGFSGGNDPWIEQEWLKRKIKAR